MFDLKVSVFEHPFHRKADKDEQWQGDKAADKGELPTKKSDLEAEHRDLHTAVCAEIDKYIANTASLMMFLLGILFQNICFQTFHNFPHVVHYILYLNPKHA